MALSLHAADVPLNPPFEPHYLGANSCSSSGCHGGAGPHQNQYLVWSLRDYHYRRPYATLTTARARQIAAALQSPDPVTDPRCTSCHAPLQAVPVSDRTSSLANSDGVSCESCHGPAAAWLRAHTRPDYTHADRVHAGMRDLKNLYVRANTCVACHQTVETPLLQAGHPELIFELDGQSVSEPKHWRENPEGSGAQIWLVGQAVALREISWQLSREAPPDATLENRWAGLYWVVHHATDGLPGVPGNDGFSLAPDKANLERVQKWSDALAQTVATNSWSPQWTHDCLRRLAGAAPEFAQAETTAAAQGRRAERLVLALDRLLAASPMETKNGPANSALNQLFALSQSLPDFNPAEFSGALEQFARTLP